MLSHNVNGRHKMGAQSENLRRSLEILLFFSTPSRSSFVALGNRPRRQTRQMATSPRPPLLIPHTIKGRDIIVDGLWGFEILERKA